MIITITFTTNNLDVAGAVMTETGEFPVTEYDHRIGRVLLHFSGPDASVAAEAYRRDHRMQVFCAARRQIFTEMQAMLQRGRR